jgi:hypothetical protein
MKPKLINSKSRFLILSLLAFLSFGLDALAGHLEIRVRDVTSGEVTNRRVLIKLQNPGAAVTGPWVLAGDYVVQYTGTNGNTIFSNVPAASYSYTVYGSPERSGVFTMPDTNGLVNVVDLTGTNSTPTYYTSSQIDTLLADIETGGGSSGTSTGAVVSITQQQLAAGTNTFSGSATLSSLTAASPLSVDFLGGTLTSGNSTMGAGGFATPGGTLNPTGFFGNATGLSNIPPAEIVGSLSTNSTIVFNVEKYGARSGTDSTLAISNAIVDATLVGGKVYFPNRNYQISAPLYLRGQVTLYSDADVESAQAAIGTITNTGTFDSIIITNYPLMPNGIKIIGVNLTANSRGSSSVAIRVQGDGTATDQLALRDFEINGFGTAVLLSNVANSVFQKVSVAYCDVGWHSDGPVNHSLTWITCPAGEVGIGYLLKSGWAHIMGCDIVYRTNAISASGTRILLENINMEVSPVAVNSARPIAIRAVSTSTSGFPTLDMKNIRVSSWSGESLTNSFSLMASNYIVKLGTGNLLLLNGYGSQIAEYNTIPSLVTEASGTRTTYVVTNITAGFAYRARPIATDLQASGVSASSSTWGDQYLNIRNSGASDQWIYNGKFVDGSYRQVNLLDFFTEKTIYNRLLLGTNAGAGFSGAGFTDGIGGLDVGATRIVLGAENNSTARGNNVAKIGHISMMPYSTANPVFTLIHGYSPSGINQLTIGGGNSSAQSATEIIFRPAATVATGAGTIVGRINTSQMEIGVPINATNGLNSIQFAVFPTNSIPLGSATATNIGFVAWRGYLVTVATNRAVGGWMWQTNGPSGVPVWGAFNPANQP